MDRKIETSQHKGRKSQEKASELWIFALASPTWTGEYLLFCVSYLARSFFCFFSGHQHLQLYSICSYNHQKIYITNMDRAGMYLVMQHLWQERCITFTSEIFWYVYSVSRQTFSNFERTEFVNSTSFLAACCKQTLWYIFATQRYISI